MILLRIRNFFKNLLALADGEDNQKAITNQLNQILQTMSKDKDIIKDAIAKEAAETRTALLAAIAGRPSLSDEDRTEILADLDNITKTEQPDEGKFNVTLGHTVTGGTEKGLSVDFQNNNVSLERKDALVRILDDAIAAGKNAAAGGIDLDTTFIQVVNGTIKTARFDNELQTDAAQAALLAGFVSLASA